MGTMPLPQPRFPANEPRAIAWFWLRYWLWFFLLLPWMLARQVFVSAYQLVAALATWNRRVTLVAGVFELQHMTSLGSLLATMLFGERFVCSRYHDVIIDPGPLFGRRILRRWLERGAAVSAIATTHSHEEHIGNAAFASALTGAPIWGTASTLQAVVAPEQLSPPRRLLMGQPQPGTQSPLRPLGSELRTERVRLRVFSSGGHCAGHASLYDPERRILFAGDSFLDTIFTAPNREVSAADWIATLRRYQAVEVATMVGSHGFVFTTDPSLPEIPFVVRRQDPNAMIARKLEFMLWASEALAEGERRGLPYGVIEACLFPWQRRWSWRNWFGDESWRLFSAGEFSRTHFVRSLSRTPERVPHRFGRFESMRAAVAALIRRRWDVVRVHGLAFHPTNVVGILCGVAASLGALGLAARLADPSLPFWSSFIAAPAVLSAGRFDLLAIIFAWWIFVWATLGGGVTRRMALAIGRAESEPLMESIRFCSRPALAFPSALASACLLLILLAPGSPGLLVPVLPVWLYAGFVYGALVTQRLSLRDGLLAAHSRIRNGTAVLGRQVRLLASFAASTGLVYLAAATCTAITWRFLTAVGLPAAGELAALAILAYALGYTMSNLKSLQIMLYLSLGP